MKRKHAGFGTESEQDASSGGIQERLLSGLGSPFVQKGYICGSELGLQQEQPHECGHAVQHAKEYAPVKMRSALVPVVQFSSKIVTWVLLAGILLIQVFPGLMLAGIALFAMTTLFSFVTLPVEIDASRRALAWLKHTGAADSETMKNAQDALKAAAYTYVVAAISSLGTLIYYIMIYTSRRS